MSFFAKPLNDVGQEDLEALIQEEVRERQTLEFKRDMYGRSDDGIREMLRDISAMANAYGGNILLGIDTVGDGVASALIGVLDAEVQAQRITSSCISNIEERIGGLVVWPVPISGGKHVIVIRMAQSLRAPHMVTFKGLNQFWVRHDRQKSPTSVHEIREACLRIEMLTTRVTEFLQNRVTGVPISSQGRATLTLSITPVLVAQDKIDTRDQELRKIIRDCDLNDGYMPSPCITGLEVRRIEGRWIRLDRNGHVDLWADLLGDMTTVDQGFRLLSAGAVRRDVINLCILGKRLYTHCNIQEPLILKLDMWNIDGLSVRGKDSFRSTPQTWSGRNLNLAPLQIDSPDELDNVSANLLQRLGEAFGFDRSPFL